MRVSCSWLNLHIFIPIRDLRKLIYSYLCSVDRIMVESAHLTKLDVQSRSPRIMSECATLGYLPLIQWLHGEKRCLLDRFVCKNAIQHDRMDILSFCISRLPPCDRHVSPLGFGTLAALLGNIDALVILKNHSLLSDANSMGRAAASNGHLHVLEWMEANNFLFIRWIRCDFVYLYTMCTDRGYTRVVEWMESKKN